MKRYFLFYGDRYYVGGGMYDFVADFDTIEEARKYLYDKLIPDWEIDWDDYVMQIFDIVEGKIVWDDKNEKTAKT
jgi:hypothetical protein